METSEAAMKDLIRIKLLYSTKNIKRKRIQFIRIIASQILVLHLMKTIGFSVLPPLILLSCFHSPSGSALDTIKPSKSIKDPQFIISQNGVFRLGFFSFANSSNRYVGILYNQIPVQTVVWVANRNTPLKDFSGFLKISDNGNLVVLNGKAETFWSSKVTNLVPNTTTAKLLDSGNLVLNNNDGVHLWESFEHPSNAFIETMKITTDVKKGQKVELRSWKSPVDPSDGNFSFSLEPSNIPECIIRNNDRLYYRTGPWNGHIFLGVRNMHSVSIDGFYISEDHRQQKYYFTYEFSDNPTLTYYEFDSRGIFVQRNWDDRKGEWENKYPILQNECEVYGKCGAFGMCDSTKQPICSCLKGFKPKDIEEWGRGNWSSGCSRTTLLRCQRDNSSNGRGNDGFFKMEMMKVPAFPISSSILDGECEDQCLKSCACVAYAYDGGIGCMFWSGDLIDVQKFSSRAVDLYIRLPYSELDEEKDKIAVVIATVIGGILINTIFALLLWRWIANRRGRKTIHKQMKLQFIKGNDIAKFYGDKDPAEVKLLQQLPLFNFEELAIATNNFHHTNKLGQGGFGPVYRGILDDGKEIAVKRLSKASGQGLEEFMNEVVVISKLQHRNLVRLHGCCVEGEEKMLVYEYMPNKSLDAFLFDPVQQKVLDWRKRYKIIEGISRGLLYLHRDSRLKIIHRDLKASNVLLDQNLNPKISDFGMARIFGGDENQANTKRVVGTYGYMSPEYAMQGQFSEKSDVFSFGVLLLEIVSGRKNTSFYDNQYHLSLLGYTWKLWKEGNIWGLVSDSVSDSDEKEISKCVHVGLLCVQEFAKDRPTMSSVVSMLSSEILDLVAPKQPAFTLTPQINRDVKAKSSLNGVTLTDLDGR